MLKIKQGKKLLIYNIFITILSLIAIGLTILDLAEVVSIDENVTLLIADRIILILFNIDYWTRFYLSKGKRWKFFKENIFDFIAIIPFNDIFMLFRATRLFRLTKLLRFIKFVRFIRLFAFIKRFHSSINKFLHTNGFIYALYITVFTILTGSTVIYLVEKGQSVTSFGDALWWSFVTATTVGYGDISPKTGMGRIVASILMLVGIGFIGMLTGTIATYFINSRVEEKTEENQEKQNTIDVSDLSDEEYKEVMNFIEFIKTKR